MGVSSRAFADQHSAECSVGTWCRNPGCLSFQLLPLCTPAACVSPDSQLCLNSGSPLGSAGRLSPSHGLGTVSGQRAGTSQGWLRLLVFPSPRDPSLIAGCSVSSKPLFHGVDLRFLSRRVNICSLLLRLGQKQRSHLHGGKRALLAVEGSELKVGRREAWRLVGAACGPLGRGTDRDVSGQPQGHRRRTGAGPSVSSRVRPATCWRSSARGA